MGITPLMNRILFYLLFLLLSTFSLCQNKDTTDKRFFAFGALLGNDLFIFHADYSITIKDNFYKLGYICDGRLLPSKSDDRSKNNDFFQSLSVTIGDRFRSNSFDALVFGGPAFGWGHKGSDNDPELIFGTVGLEAKALLMFRASDNAEFGVGCFGNVNPEKCFFGITLSFVLTNGN